MDAAGIVSGVSLTLKADATSVVELGGLIVKAQFSSDGVLFSDAASVEDLYGNFSEFLVAPDNGTHTATGYTTLKAAGAKAVRLTAHNSSNEPITSTLVAAAF